MDGTHDVCRVTLLGRVGADPQVREASDAGPAMARFAVCTEEAFTDGAGQPRRARTWHSIFVFGATASSAADLRRGDRVYLSGTMRNGEDSAPGDALTIEVVLGAPGSDLIRLSPADPAEEAEAGDGDAAPAPDGPTPEPAARPERPAAEVHRHPSTPEPVRVRGNGARRGGGIGA